MRLDDFIGVNTQRTSVGWFSDVSVSCKSDHCVKQFFFCQREFVILDTYLMRNYSQLLFYTSLLLFSPGSHVHAGSIQDIGSNSEKSSSDLSKKNLVQTIAPSQNRSSRSWFSSRNKQAGNTFNSEDITVSQVYKYDNSPKTPEKVDAKSFNYLTGLLSSEKGLDHNNLPNKLLQDSKRLLVDRSYQFASAYATDKIQAIPFFAQTSISLSAGTESETNFSFDSLMKLKELGNDDDGDLTGLVFSQGRFSTSTNSDGSTANLGLGFRHRPNDHSMWGGNTFFDYRMTDYSSAHSRLGIGGEYFWKDLEFRNNWYLAITDKKDVTINGNSYTERVVPGWDAEAGYRLPEKPELAFFVRGFNWDYEDTDDNSGLEGSINWQATPNINLEAWVSNEIAANDTKVNSQLPGTDETFYGLRFRLTAQPVKFLKKDTKANLIAQMTQPVRRKYDVLLERSSGTFINRARGI